MNFSSSRNSIAARSRMRFGIRCNNSERWLCLRRVSALIDEGDAPFHKAGPQIFLDKIPASDWAGVHRAPVSEVRQGTQ